MESMVFSQLEINRSRTLAILEGVQEEQSSVVPKGFNNNILWHIGHILTTQERLSLRMIGEPLDLPEELMSFFLNGTKPAEWPSTPPDLATLKKLLEEQPGRIRERLQGKLKDKITVPFKEFNTLEEVLIFSIGHESLHAGYIMALKKAVAVQ